MLTFKERLQRGLLLMGRYLSLTLGVPALIIVLVMGWRLVNGTSLNNEDWIATILCILYIITAFKFDAWSANLLEKIKQSEQRNEETSEANKM